MSRRCAEFYSNEARPRGCRSKFCDSCEKLFGGMRVHFYAEAPQKRVNSERKRRRVISREEVSELSGMGRNANCKL